MKRVLIVDDAIDLGRLLQDALKVTHPETPITVVPSAEEALLESTRFTFDLLVTDLRLPGMSGVELIRKIRVRQPGIKVILITALMPEDRLVRQKDEVHPDIFIRKPMSVASFLEAVDSLIGSEEAEGLVEEKAEDVVGPVQEQEFQHDEEISLVSTAPEPIKEEQVGAPAQTWVELEQPQKNLPAPDVLSDLAAVFGSKPQQDDGLPLKPPDRDQMGATFPKQTIPGAAGQPRSIAEIINQLKSSLGALAVVQTGVGGEITALEGLLPESISIDQLVPAALASLSGGTAVSYLLGNATSRSVQVFHGTEFNLLFAPLESGMLMIFLPAGHSALRLAIAVEEALAVQVDFAAIHDRVDAESTAGGDEVFSAIPSVEQLGVTRSLSEEDLDAALADPDLEKLNKLVTGRLAEDTQLDDANSFWESAAVSETKEQNLPGFLTYEQAQAMGLLSLDDEDEEK